MLVKQMVLSPIASPASAKRRWMMFYHLVGARQSAKALAKRTASSPIASPVHGQPTWRGGWMGKLFVFHQIMANRLAPTTIFRDGLAKSVRIIRN
jgi:hypothetical protein